MSAEDDINMLKQIPPLSNFEKKRKFRSTIMLFVATFVSILFFVYAYLRKLEADKQAVIAQEQRLEAKKQKEIAVALQKLAEVERMDAEKARMEAVAAQREAERVLAECERVRRK